MGRTVPDQGHVGRRQDLGFEQQGRSKRLGGEQVRLTADLESGHGWHHRALTAQPDLVRQQVQGSESTTTRLVGELGHRR